MGVKGLTGLIASNPNLLRRHFLHDTSVVMDGLNIAFLLYLETDLDCVRGGEFFAYAEIIRRYFAMFAEANISCIVVLDGAYEPDVKTLTICHRNRQKIALLKQLTGSDAQKIKVKPNYATKVFLEVIRSIPNVEVIQCLFEADETLAKIANERGFPVISNDSDFYVFGLKAGLIPLSSLDNYLSERNLPNGSTVPGLSCKMFRLVNLLRAFEPPIKSELMPLFGTIVGNDYVTEEDFEKFFQTIHVPKRCKLRFNPNQRRLIATLNFLSLQSSFEKCIAIILGKIPMSRRGKLEKLIREGTTRYRMEYSQEQVLRFPNGTEVPKWLVKNFIEGKQSSQTMSLISTGMNTFSIQIEALHLRSSNEITLPLRKELYNTVCKDNMCEVIEVDRSGYDLRKTIVPVEPDDIGLFDLESMGVRERRICLRRKVLMKSTADDVVTSPCGKMLIWSLEYMVNYGKVNKSFCLCALLTNIAAQVFATETGSPEESTSFLLDKKVECNQLNSFRKYIKKGPLSERINIKVTHLINQYYATLATVRMLCRLFGFDIETFRWHLVVDGVFLYNLYNDVSQRGKPESYFFNLFQKTGDLKRDFSKLWSSIEPQWFPVEYMKS